jgi:hypothetical protein
MQSDREVEPADEQEYREECEPTAELQYVESVFDLTPERVENIKTIKPSKLGITCRRTACVKSDLHCFDSTIWKPSYSAGLCQDCGAERIDWDIFHSRTMDDVEQKFDYLKNEWIRHFFFNVPITKRIEEDAGEKGYSGLKENLESLFHRKIMREFNKIGDRRQTSMLNGTIVEWARHATGCCCRRCVSYWHGIPLNVRLAEDDVEYFTNLSLRYISLRLPKLFIDAH